LWIEYYVSVDVEWEKKVWLNNGLNIADCVLVEWEEEQGLVYFVDCAIFSV
jgi:hypothetical protein